MQNKEKPTTLKGIRTLAVSTSFSRILGLARDMVSATLFGTSLIWDAFVVAFTLPNLFRRLFGEGAMTTAFVPRFSELLTQEPGRAKKYANQVMIILGLILIAVVLLIEITFALLKKFDLLSLQWQSIASLSQLMMPYMIPICLAAVGMGILNSMGHFLIPSLSPIVLNVFMIAGQYIAIFLHQSAEKQIYVISSMVLIAGFFQFAMQWPKLKLFQIPWRFTWPIDPMTKNTFQAMLPATLSMAVFQINLIMDKILATLLKPGAVSALFYADRLMELPLGIFGISFSVAALPLFSKLIAQKNLYELQKSSQHTILASLAIMIPSSIAFLILAKPIIQLLFEHHAFSAESTTRTQMVLICYCIGLPLFTINKVLSQIFYAEKDLKTPMRIALKTLLYDLVLNIALMVPIKEAGLALATSLAAYVQLFYIVKALKVKYPGYSFIPSLRQSMEVILLTLIYAISLWGVWCMITHQLPFINLTYRIIDILLITPIGVMLWFGLGYLLHSDATHIAWHWITQKREKNLSIPEDD